MTTLAERRADMDTWEPCENDRPSQTQRAITVAMLDLVEYLADEYDPTTAETLIDDWTDSMMHVVESVAETACDELYRTQHNNPATTEREAHT